MRPQPRAHAGKGCLGHVEAAAQVYAHDLVPILERHLVEDAITRDAGVVHHHVYLAVHGGDIVAIVDAGLVIAHVPAIGGYACRLREGTGSLDVAGIVGGNGEAHVLQCQADRFANAPGTAGNDCNACHDTPPLAHFLPARYGNVASAASGQMQEDPRISGKNCMPAVSFRRVPEVPAIRSGTGSQGRRPDYPDCHPSAGAAGPYPANSGSRP